MAVYVSLAALSPRPKTILLHFKRFIVTQQDNGEFVTRKNKANIPLKETLSLSSFLSSENESHPENESPNGLYHLRGIVHHHGDDIDRGHYTATTMRNDQNDEDNWVLSDDSVCKTQTVEELNDEPKQKQCYLVAYSSVGVDMERNDLAAQVSTTEEKWKMTNIVTENDLRKKNPKACQTCSLGMSVCFMCP